MKLGEFWIARDGDGQLHGYDSEPRREPEWGDRGEWAVEVNGDYFKLKATMFENLKWEDPPIKVKLFAL